MSKIPQVKEYDGWPVVTAEKMKFLDKKASMEYGIKELDLMENAGRKIAEEILKQASADKFLICSGRGNNGGDGLVAARYLKKAQRDAEVLIVAPRSSGYGALVVENISRAREAGVPVNMVDGKNVEDFEGKFRWADAFVDALLGVSAIGKPAGAVRRLIQMMNRTGKKIFAVDIPSGLSPDTGHHSGVFVKAHMTFTLGFPKSGLMAPHAQKNIGELRVIDIGYPKGIMEEAKR